VTWLYRVLECFAYHYRQTPAVPVAAADDDDDGGGLIMNTAYLLGAGVAS
jgi:hypothetical protein